MATAFSPNFSPLVLIEFKLSMVIFASLVIIHPRTIAVRNRRWVWAPRQVRLLPPEDEKKATIAACDKFVTEILKPRFLPSIRPTEFNYPINLYGKWHGACYRFIERFRSNPPDAIEPEFEHTFARVDYLASDRFDVMWHRHTGQWWRLYHSVSLVEALHRIEQDGHLHPL